MNQIIKDCAAEHERRLDNQEELEASVRATIVHWKKMAVNNLYQDDLSREIYITAFNHIDDPYGFVHLALMAQLSGNGAAFLESQLKALATCEVDHG